MTEHKKQIVGSKRIALLLLEEKVEALKQVYIDELAELQRDWKELVIVIGEELGIDSKSKDSQHWKLNKGRDAFVYTGQGNPNPESTNISGEGQEGTGVDSKTPGNEDG